MTVATSGAETRANRWAGPCHACGLHVRCNDGTIVREGDAWRLYCAAHRGGSTPPANDRPSNGAPAGGDAPQLSEAAARAALALLRHAATDKRRPEGALDALTEIATLCVWRVGTPELARELYAALPSKVIAEPADERASDIIGAILDRKGERVIDDATAAATADALVGPPVDSPTSRAYAVRPYTLAEQMRGADCPRQSRLGTPKSKRKGAGRWAHRKDRKG